MDDASHTTDQPDHTPRGQGFDGGESAAASAPADIEAKLREVLEERATIATNLAGLGARVESQRAQLAATEKEYATAYRDAVDAGWSEKDLSSKIGLPNPSAAPRRRRAPRKPQTTDNRQ